MKGIRDCLLKCCPAASLCELEHATSQRIIAWQKIPRCGHSLIGTQFLVLWLGRWGWGSPITALKLMTPTRHMEVLGESSRIRIPSRFHRRRTWVDSSSGIESASSALLGPDFPYGTMFVNISGSLVMGLLAGWFAHRGGGSKCWF